jgi:hypothetical protein
MLRLLAPEGPSSRPSGLPVSGWRWSALKRLCPALEALLKTEETAGIACLAIGGLRNEKAGDLLRALGRGGGRRACSCVRAGPARR